MSPGDESGSEILAKKSILMQAGVKIMETSGTVFFF